MRLPPGQLSHLIIEELKANPEIRILALVVAIRKRLGKLVWKGDLPNAVQSTLRKLIYSNTVVQTGDMYSLAPL